MKWQDMVALALKSGASAFIGAVLTDIASDGLDFQAVELAAIAAIPAVLMVIYQWLTTGTVDEVTDGQ